MDLKELNELFIKIKLITGIEDIAYHKFENGGLLPVHKLETKDLKCEDWKEAHSRMQLRIKDDWALTMIAEEKKTFYMSDTELEDNSPSVFRKFKIKSILAIPIIKDNVAVGMIDIPSIETKVELSDTQIKECEKLAFEFSKTLK